MNEIGEEENLSLLSEDTVKLGRVYRICYT